MVERTDTRQRRNFAGPLAVARGIRLVSSGLMMLAAIACLALMLHVIAEVVGRNLFNHPLEGTTELIAKWWMITIVFLGLAYTQLKREHVRATVITEWMPENWQRGAEIATVAILFLFAAAVAYYGWDTAINSFQLREATDTHNRIPVWPFVFLVPIGAAAAALQCVGSIIELLLGQTDESAGWEGEIL